MSTLVMSGNFDTFTMDEVLEVVGLSRQIMEVTLHNNAENTGRILLKSGRVLHAEAQHTQPGKPSLSNLFENPGTRFEVHRITPPPPLPKPLGSLMELLSEVRASLQNTVSETSPPPQTAHAQTQLDQQLQTMLSELRELTHNSTHTFTKQLATLDQRISTLQSNNASPNDIKTTIEASIAQLKLGSASRFEWIALIVVCTLQFFTLLATVFLLGAS